MTMARQFETQSTLSRSENSTPEPTISDNDENIILGYDTYREQQAARSLVDLEKTPEAKMLDSMYDEYVQVLVDPQSEYAFDRGEETPKEVHTNDTGEIILTPAEKKYDIVSKKDVLKAKYDDLVLYTAGSLHLSDIDITHSLLSVDEMVNLNNAQALMVQETVEASIQQAIERAGYPAHISFESEGEDVESKTKFIEVLNEGIKDLGSVAIRSIRAATLFSMPIKVHEATAEKPADPENLTGDTLTVTLNTIKK